MTPPALTPRSNSSSSYGARARGRARPTADSRHAARCPDADNRNVAPTDTIIAERFGTALVAHREILLGEEYSARLDESAASSGGSLFSVGHFRRRNVGIGRALNRNQFSASDRPDLPPHPRDDRYTRRRHRALSRGRGSVNRAPGVKGDRGIASPD